jgi:hypothetical protein
MGQRPFERGTIAQVIVKRQAGVIDEDIEIVEPQEKERLLRAYWSIPERQIETSVVLVDLRWRESQSSDA